MSQSAASTKAATVPVRQKGAHEDLDLRIAWSGVGLTTAQVEAALGEIWNRPLKPVKEPTRDYAPTGPGTLAGGVLRKSWQPAYISGDLKPGWAATVRVLSEEITIFRSQEGKAHAIGGRCAHRGVLLSTGMVQGDSLRCPYHGWKYDAEGHCLAQPAEPEFDATVTIPGYPVHEYLGLLFIYMGGDTPPPPPHYPEFEGSGVIATFRVECPWNYFQHLENAVDETHLAFLHDRSTYMAVNFAVPKIEVEETGYGFAQYGIRNGNLKRRKYVHMPNMTAWPQPSTHPEETAWREFLGWRVPVDDRSHVTIGVAHHHVPEEKIASFVQSVATERKQLSMLPSPTGLAMDVLTGKARSIDIELRDPPSDMTAIQDFYAMIGQGAMADRENERLGPADLGILTLRKLYEQEMRKVAEGKPLTRWEPSIPMPHPGPLPKPVAVNK